VGKRTAPPLLIYIGLVAAIGVSQGLIWGYAAFIGKLAEPLMPGHAAVHPGRGSPAAGPVLRPVVPQPGHRTPWGFVADRRDLDRHEPGGPPPAAEDGEAA
jgi:hypothetical protein